MNKKSVTLIVLLLVLGALLAVFFLMPKESDGTDTVNTAITAETISVISKEASTVNSVVFAADGEEPHAFSYAGGAWHYDADGAFPFSEQYIVAMANAGAGLTAEKKISDPGELSEYGLEAPSVEVSLGFSDGTAESFTLGDYNAFSGTYYLNYGGDIYTATPDVYSAFAKKLFDLIPKKELPALSGDGITSISLDGKEVSAETLETLGAAFAEITEEGIADYKNPENYGFGTTDTEVKVKYTVTSTDSDGNEASEDRELTVSLAFDDDGCEYMTFPGSDVVYSVKNAEAFRPVE